MPSAPEPASRRTSATERLVRSTTILSVRRAGSVALAGDGQVTIGQTVAKADATKVRRLEQVGADQAGVLAGFAGSAADAFALLERFESTLARSPTHLLRASIELAKAWRTDRALRRLDALLIVADLEVTLVLSGQGDVIQPTEGICATGSGGPFAHAAAQALLRHSEMSAEDICRAAMEIAAELCIYTNERQTVLTL